MATRMTLPNFETTQLQLRALNHRFVHEAIDPAGAMLDASTAADFLHTAADGQWHGREAFIAHGRRLPPPGDARLETQEVRLFGRVALVLGTHTSGGPEATRTRFTDVYVWQAAAWQRVAAQDTTLRAGVGVPLNRGTLPASPRWSGLDPSGDDPTVLHALNEHYVRAFREADVSWYDAHLSADYVVISGDGSLNDRATALTNFAKPTFASSMRSFPVGRVNVRRFDDVALIHAENDYELNDGRRGISRYTDIWVRQSQVWRCVAAHITPHRLP